MQFHDHLPEKNCPPVEADIPKKMKVYCLIKNDTPSLEDFKSLKERRPERFFDDPDKDCQSCGLSVFTDLEGIELAKQISRSLRKRKTAEGLLTENTGEIQNTPSNRTGNTHHTWWPLKNINPCEIFNVVNP
ncbi:hypothetical protein [Picosynechococcus sp. PCC 73109]|uniref:hypothetical protein n=1 Tax=Picosynechococcus sp. PCC 73109 TaxID=374982 RepID=UPI000A95614B|nr:hypothetical protein [Picosynechococcus sp. PCC 73109]